VGVSAEAPSGCRGSCTAGGSAADDAGFVGTGIAGLLQIGVCAAFVGNPPQGAAIAAADMFGQALILQGP